MQFSKITLVLKLAMFLKSSIMNKNTISQRRGLFYQQRFKFNIHFTDLLESNKIPKKARLLAKAASDKAKNGLCQASSGNAIEGASVSCILSRVENNHCFYGRFDIGPFSVGQGITVATMFRRALLSELSGLAITAVEILGVDHEFFTLPGINESVQDILLNLKQIHFRSEFSSNLNNSEFAFLSKQGPAIVKASDMKLPASLKCVDPNQYIATLGFDGYLNLKMQISSGSAISRKGLSSEAKTGQFLAKQPFDLDWPIPNILDSDSEYIQQKLNKGQSKLKTETKLVKKNNILPVEAVFMPVTKVNYLISLDENKIPSNEHIILEIWTNGSITPKAAIKNAAHSLLQLILPFSQIKQI